MSCNNRPGLAADACHSSSERNTPKRGQAAKWSSQDTDLLIHEALLRHANIRVQLPRLEQRGRRTARAAEPMLDLFAF